MSDQKPKICACICTYNRDEFLYKALESLGRQSLDPSDFEVLLIDNNSTDSTPDLAKRFEQEYPNINFRYFLEEKQGESAARNRALTETNCPLIDFIDDDAIAVKDYLKALVDFFDEYPNAMAAGGKILPYFYPRGEWPDWLSHYLLGLVSCLDYGDEVKPFPKYPFGCNMVFRKEVFDELGNFDSRLGRKKRNLIGSSDKDMFMRMKEAKMPIYYVPEALVYHIMPEERTTMDFIEQVSVGIGQSEKLRYQNEDLKHKIQILITQTVKTIGTFLIALSYFFKGEKAKGQMLIRYRQWFIKGFFNPNNEAIS